MATKTPTTSEVEESLKFWGLDLKYREDWGEWVVSGETIEGAPQTRLQAIDFLTAELDWVDIPRENLEQKFEWRNEGFQRRGWAVNVKLHNVWKYQTAWENMLDLRITDDEYNEFSLWDDLCQQAYDDFLDLAGEYDLDPDRFFRGGRSGGYIVYERENLSVACANQLLKLYEQVPDMVDNLAQEIAAATAAQQFADKHDASVVTYTTGCFTVIKGDYTLSMVLEKGVQ